MSLVGSFLPSGPTSFKRDRLGILADARRILIEPASVQDLKSALRHNDHHAGGTTALPSCVPIPKGNDLG